MKKILAFFVLVPLLFGCTEDSDSGNSQFDVPYYKFTSSDTNFLLKNTYSRNSTVTFKNQMNALINFKVISNETQKREFAPGTFSGGGLLLNYFDNKTIVLKSLTHTESEHYLILQIYKFDANSINGGFSFYMWNGLASGYLNTQLSYNMRTASKSTMMLNNVTYQNVITLNSESPYAYPNENYTINVNKLYYDITSGVIGFDDLDGNQWRLVN